MIAIVFILQSVPAFGHSQYRDKELPEEFYTYLESDTPSNRSRAYSMMHMYHSDTIDRILTNFINKDKRSHVVMAAIGVSTHCKRHIWDEKWMKYSTSEDSMVRRAIAYKAGFHFLHKTKSRQALIKLSKDKNDWVRDAAKWSINNQRIYSKNRNNKWWTKH